MPIRPPSTSSTVPVYEGGFVAGQIEGGVGDGAGRTDRPGRGAPHHHPSRVRARKCDFRGHDHPRGDRIHPYAGRAELRRQARVSVSSAPLLAA